MARKTKAEALETREQLLDAAERVFRARGVGNATLEEVATAAGMTRGAVYHHFDSKAALFEALVRRAEMPMGAAFGEPGVVVGDPLAAVRDQAVLALRHLADSARVRNIFEIVSLRCEYSKELAPVARRRKKEANQCLAQCGGLLDQAVARGQLPKGTDTALAARALHSYIGGLMRDWVQAPRSFDLHAAAPGLIGLFLAGLRACPPRVSGIA
ncbi:MAG TPA: TetR family transcriptional regulator [Burkholderiaceae bacterium]|nr:TetR family transcriptional regulator [Burkholderiaceae bacterium]